LRAVFGKIGKEVLAEKNLAGDAVDALLEGVYEIEDRGLEDRGSMNSAGRRVLRWYGRELGGNRHVMWWVVGREA